MSIEWGENAPSAKLRKRLAEPGEREARRMTRTATIRGGPGRDSRLEFSVQGQIRRYPLSSLLLAAGFGLLLGGVLLAGVAGTVRSHRLRRNWTRHLH
jgi:hypothetical protein